VTETEVLQKLASYKDAIIKLKNERNENKELAQKATDEATHWQNSYNTLKEQSYHTIKHLVEDNIEQKEVEIENLHKTIDELQNQLNDKDYLTNLLKNNFNIDIDDLRKQSEKKYVELDEKYQQLKAFSETVQSELEKVRSQNGFYKSDIEKLQQRLQDIQSQNQQTRQNEQAAKEAFMQELSRVVNEASEVLKN